MSSNNSEVPFLRGQPIPFGRLAPDQFEAFIISILTTIADSVGLVEVQRKGATGDAGFDADARDKLNPEFLHCIQCKRWGSKAFGITDVAHEVIKVALRSYIDGVTIVKHWFICSNAVTKDVRNLNRNNVSLRRAIIEIIAAGSLKDEAFALSTQLRSDADVSAIITKYIDNLTTFVIWEQQNLDDQISAHYSQLLPIIERFFQLERLLVQYPRPNFNKATYFGRLKSRVKSVRGFVQLDTAISDSPKNLKLLGLAPVDKSKSSLSQNARQGLKFDHLTIVTGNGGAGKSTYLLQHIEQLLADDNIETIPIFIDLEEGYLGNLEEVIRAELGLLPNDHWKSIPYKFLLLIDGFDTVQYSTQILLIKQISDLLRDGVACLLAIRESGPRNEIVIRPSTKVVRILPLNNAKIIKWIDSALDPSHRNRFLDQYRVLSFPNSHTLINLPFWIDKLLKVYKHQGTLGSTVSAIMDAYFESWLSRNPPTSLAIFDFPMLRKLLGVFAYFWRIKLKRSYISREELLTIAAEAIVDDKLLDPRIYQSVKLEEIFELLRRNDLISENFAGLWRFEHEITADYLASIYLAKNWKSDLSDLKNSSKTDDAWLFAVHFLEAGETTDFVQQVFDSAMDIGVSCARESRNESEILKIESQLLEKFQTLDGFEGGRAAYNLGRLGSPRGLSVLRQYIMNPFLDLNQPERSTQLGKFFAAKRALALIGDREPCQILLELADKQDSGVGTASGGDIYYWSLVPRNLAVELSRLRINSEAINLNVTIKTLSSWGLKSDWDQILKRIESMKAWHDVLRGIRGLYRLDLERSIKEIGSELHVIRPPEYRVYMNEIHHAFTGDCEVDWLLDFILSPVEAERANRHEVQNARGRAYEMLSEMSPTDYAINKIVSMIRSNYSYEVHYAWLLARDWQVHNVETELTRALKSENPMLIQDASSYLGKVHLGHHHQELVSLAIENIKDPEVLWPHVAYDTIIEICTSSEKAEFIADRLNLKLERILDGFEQLEIRQHTGEELNSHVPLMRPEFVFQTFAKVLAANVSLVRMNLLRRILLYDLTFINVDKYLLEIIKVMPQTDREFGLENARRSWTKLHVIRLLSEYELSDFSTAIFSNIVVEFFEHPAASADIMTTMNNAWSDSLAKVVLSGIARCDFGSTIQLEAKNIFSSGIVSLIIGKLTYDQHSSYLLPLITTKPGPASALILKFISDGFMSLRKFDD